MKALIMAAFVLASVLILSAVITVCLIGFPSIVFEMFNGYYPSAGDDTLITVFCLVALIWGAPKFFEIYNDLMGKKEA